MSNLFRHFLNNWPPAQCLLCTSLLKMGAHTRSALCHACAISLPYWQAGESCPQCARPHTGGVLCGACQNKPPAYDQTYALCLYVDPVKSLIHAAKFGLQWSLLAPWGDLLAQAVQQSGNTGDTLPKIDWIVPMPLHRRRLQERGFNQALEIARPLSAALAIELKLDLLQRTRDTEHQARLSAQARWKNLRGAFACTSNCNGKTIILVDDVMTSGASLHAAAKVLKQAGAVQVINIVLARTPDH